LVHPEFEKYMKYAVSKGLYACLSINPILLTPDVAERLLEARPAKLYVALDGQDDASFEKIRGLKNAYEKSKENLLRFLKMKTERGIKTKIMLSMIDFELNAASIAKLKDYWISVPGVDEFLCKPFITWSGDAADVNKFAAPKAKGNAELAKSVGFVTCNKPWYELSVTWDGDVIACCFDYDKKVPLGSVKEQTLAQIWNGPQMQALRREFIENKVSNPLCRDCTYLHS
jgi:radical SAM protein with 4Fe4S-binding SPASM domain